MKAETPILPHSWTLKNWPANVYPADAIRARHVLRVNQKALVAAGALTRIGRELVVLGAGYAKWLASNAPRVVEFEVPANSRDHAHKRFGRANQKSKDQ